MGLIFSLLYVSPFILYKVLYGMRVGTQCNSVVSRAWVFLLKIAQYRLDIAGKEEWSKTISGIVYGRICI